MKTNKLKNKYFDNELPEAGCDEAGRGCLAGPVVAAAVIFPPGYVNISLNDSKKLNERQRYNLRDEIKRDALCWAVGIVDNEGIDKINILRASFKAMHLAIDDLDRKPAYLIIDGNRFIKYKDIPHYCIIKGDSKYMSIAAASIIAKTHRDDIMKELANDFPEYDWDKNKGYPTKAHREAIKVHGPCKFHRRSFQLLQPQLEIPFTD